MITVTMSISCSLTDSLKGLMKLQYFGSLMLRQVTGKDSDAGEEWRQKEKRVAEDEMLEQHHRLRRHELEQTPGHNEGQGSLPCCSQWGCRVRHDLATEQQLQQHTPSLGIPYIPEELITVWGTEQILNKHLLSDIVYLATSVYCCLSHIILGCKFLFDSSQSPSVGTTFIRNSVTLLW